ncbi:hypothetical protein [Sulfitobacter sp. THAF37]|nr:hypothetical protein [Sulfitobacter sp. THAF37]
MSPLSRLLSADRLSPSTSGPVFPVLMARDLRLTITMQDVSTRLTET